MVNIPYIPYGAILYVIKMNSTPSGIYFIDNRLYPSMENLLQLLTNRVEISQQSLLHPYYYIIEGLLKYLLQRLVISCKR